MTLSGSTPRATIGNAGIALRAALWIAFPATDLLVPLGVPAGIRCVLGSLAAGWKRQPRLPIAFALPADLFIGLGRVGGEIFSSLAPERFGFRSGLASERAGKAARETVPEMPSPGFGAGSPPHEHIRPALLRFDLSRLAWLPLADRDGVLGGARPDRCPDLVQALAGELAFLSLRHSLRFGGREAEWGRRLDELRSGALAFRQERRDFDCADSLQREASGAGDDPLDVLRIFDREVLHLDYLGGAAADATMKRIRRVSRQGRPAGRVGVALDRHRRAPEAANRLDRAG